MELLNKVQECGADNLIAGIAPAAMTTGVKVRKAEAETAYPRGMVMALSLGEAGDGCVVPLGTDAKLNETLAAAYILADDVTVGTEGDAAAVAYMTGCFARKAVTAKAEYAMTAADEDSLRKYGIVLKDMLD